MGGPVVRIHLSVPSFAAVAQMAVRRLGKAEGVGPSPTRSSKIGGNMAAEAVKLTEEAMHEALEGHVYAAVRFTYPAGNEGYLAEMWVADTQQDINRAVDLMRLKPGRIDIHRKAD